MHNRLREPAKLAALVLAGLVLAVLLAEALLRAVGFHQPQLYEPHRQLGWTLRPGAEDWYTDEGRALIQVNSAGMRDREHAVAKSADVTVSRSSATRIRRPGRSRSTAPTGPSCPAAC
jgi:hypothetical protein